MSNFNFPFEFMWNSNVTFFLCMYQQQQQLKPRWKESQHGLLRSSQRHMSSCIRRRRGERDFPRTTTIAGKYDKKKH